MPQNQLSCRQIKFLRFGQNVFSVSLRNPWPDKYRNVVCQQFWLWVTWNSNDFSLTPVFLHPQVLPKVAGRGRKNRNVVLRFEAPRKGANTLPRDTQVPKHRLRAILTLGDVEF